MDPGQMSPGQLGSGQMCPRTNGPNGQAWHGSLLFHSDGTNSRLISYWQSGDST